MKINWTCKHCQTENELQTFDDTGEILMEMMETKRAMQAPREYVVTCQNPDCRKKTKLQIYE